jgi:hypothetical protein
MRGLKRLVFTGAACAMFVGPAASTSFAQCSVISADARCTESVMPNLRVDFGVPPPAVLGFRLTSRPVRAAHGRASADVPLLFSASARECRPAAPPRTRGGHRRRTVIEPTGTGSSHPTVQRHGLCGTARR